jgi:hypothetical protein
VRHGQVDEGEVFVRDRQTHLGVVDGVHMGK